VRDELQTARLRLRRWRPEDLDIAAAWNANPILMEHMGKPSFTREETEDLLARFEKHWAEHGFGVWAAEERETGSLVGRVGISYHRSWPDDPEIGWLIDVPWQGQGLATEAGAACVDYALGELGFERVVSICTAENAASRRVMEKLGFSPWRQVDEDVFGLRLIVHSRTRQTLLDDTSKAP
jgi:RimJ/RimL family protein N-acetyltransferase